MNENILRSESTEPFEYKGNITDLALYRERKSESMSSYNSFDKDDEQGIPPINVSDYPSKRSKKGIRTIRTFYTKKMLVAISWLSDNHEPANIDSIPYMQQLFENIKRFFKEHFDDPYSSFLTALYDALAYDNSWINLTKGDFIAIKNLMTNLNNQPNLDYEKIDKAINKLEKMGLDTTPF